MYINPDRIIEVTGQFNQELEINFTRHFVKLNRSDGDIFILINSRGGSISCLKTIAALISSSKNAVHTVVLGCKIGSCAAQLFVLGKRRILLSGSILFFHEPRLIFEEYYESPLSQLIQEVDSLKQDNAMFLTQISTVCNLTVTDIDLKLKANWELDSTHALKLGIATEVVCSLSDLFE